MLIACTNPEHTKSDIVELHARVRPEHKAGSRGQALHRSILRVILADLTTAPPQL